MLRSIGLALAQLILPAHCASCGNPADREGRFPLCGPCGRAMAALLQASYCPRCGRGTGPYAADLDGCSVCRAEPPGYDGAARAGAYAEPLRGLILSYKYKRHVELRPILGRLLAERVAAAPWADLVDVVVPVPLHWSRRWYRGFNQAQGLAAEVVRAMARPLASRGLLRVRPTPHQTRLPRPERAANVRGAFALRGAGRAVAGKTVLLVDDVLTTGATAGECARVLRKAGATSVFVAVVAVAEEG